MNRLKRVLALLGLACMAVFLASVIFCAVTGSLAAHQDLVLGSLSAFLLTGGGAVVIRYLQNRSEDKASQEGDRE